MAERLDQITRDIQSARSSLGSNLQELEDRVRHETDWKTHFQRNSMTLLGLAFGGGVLVAAMMSNGKAAESSRTRGPSGDMHKGPGADTWGTLKGALIGLAGLKVRTVLNEVLPGFNGQYERMERELSAAGASRHHGHELDSARHM